MLPTKSNHTKDGCVATSSNCVIWQGPDIECINLCKGDTVSDVVAKLATELCEILNQINLNFYDLSCLDLATQPLDFQDLMQIIVTRICNSETEIDNIKTGNTGGGGGSSSVCPDECIVVLPTCLQYTNPSTGSLVTTSSLTNFVTLLGNKLCLLQTTVNQNTESITQIINDIDDLTVRVEDLESTGGSGGTPTNVNINCITGTNSTPIVTAVQTIATTLCELESVVDTIAGTDIDDAIAKQCVGLSNSNVLVGAGTMQQINGWVLNPTTIADSLTNLWITVCDMRSAVANILTNCCDSICNGVLINMAISYNSTTNNIEILFTGTIPTGLTANPTLTTLTITQPGFTGTTTVAIQSIINTPTAHTFTKPSGLNELVMFSVNGLFNSQSVDDTCSTPITGFYSPSAECPDLTITPTSNSVEYSFTSTSSTTSYIVELRAANNVTLIGSNTHQDPATGLLTYTFTNLTPATTYNLILGYDLGGATRWTYCDPISVTLDSAICLKPNTADSSINVQLTENP